MSLSPGTTSSRAAGLFIYFRIKGHRNCPEMNPYMKCIKIFYIFTRSLYSSHRLPNHDGVKSKRVLKPFVWISWGGPLPSCPGCHDSLHIMSEYIHWIKRGATVMSVDPDPDLEYGSESGSMRAKITHKNRKKWRNVMFWSAGCSFWGLKASSVAWTSLWRHRDS